MYILDGLSMGRISSAAGDKESDDNHEYYQYEEVLISLHPVAHSLQPHLELSHSHAFGVVPNNSNNRSIPDIVL